MTLGIDWDRPWRAFPPPRARPQAGSFWPRDLRVGALHIGSSDALFWASFATGHWVVSIPDSGPIDGRLVLAWTAVLVHVSAWPTLWVGLRDLRGRQPNDASPVVAWWAFVLTKVVVLAAVFAFPLESRAISGMDAWIFVLYVTASPYLGWSFVPVLALHGILFGRVAAYLEPEIRYLADLGAVAILAAAAAMTVAVLQTPAATASAESWSARHGILAASALAGYVLIAFGMSGRLVPVTPQIQTRRALRRESRLPEGSLEVLY